MHYFTLLSILSLSLGSVVTANPDRGLHARSARAEAEANAGYDMEESNLFGRDAEPEAGPAIDLIPRSWLEPRAQDGAIHLGDDGILRNLAVKLPRVSKRSDEHHLMARWEVVDAVPLSPRQIKRWYTSHEGLLEQRSHFDEVYADVDGRKVHPREWMDPHPSLLPRQLGTLAEVKMDQLAKREAIAEAEDGGVLLKRELCRSNSDCLFYGWYCHKVDMAVTGVCVSGNGRQAGGSTAKAPAKVAGKSSGRRA